jgi:hypothetical protein
VRLFAGIRVLEHQERFRHLLVDERTEPGASSS